MMGTLRDFLLARILEEETLAQEAIDARPDTHAWSDVTGPEGAHFAHWNPWRVLSSCVTKRLILAAHRDVGAGLDRRAEPDRALKAHACSTCGQYDEYAIEWPCYTLRVLALEWVEHPDYRIEWRPQRLSSGVGRAPAASSTAAPPTPALNPSSSPAATGASSTSPAPSPAQVVHAPDQAPRHVPKQAPGQPAA
jgi:hypothetical protein